MNDVFFLMDRTKEYYEKRIFENWYLEKIEEQIKHWDETFDMTYLNFRKNMSKISENNIKNSNPNKVFEYNNQSSFDEIIKDHKGWIILIGDDDFISKEVVLFLQEYNDYKKIPCWNAVTIYPFTIKMKSWPSDDLILSKDWDGFEIEEEETYYKRNFCFENVLFCGSYAIHTSHKKISPWEISPIRNHFNSKYFDKNELFFVDFDLIYTSIFNKSILKLFRNKKEIINFMNCLKNGELKYPEEFKEEENSIKELINSIKIINDCY